MCNFFCIILPFSLEPPALGIIFKTDNPEVSAKPVQFTKVAHIVGKGFDEVFFWYPIAPPGYASLGCMVSRTDEAPSIDTLCCPRMDLVNQANILEAPISRSSSSKASQCWSIWKVENQVNMFTWLLVLSSTAYGCGSQIGMLLETLLDFFHPSPILSVFYPSSVQIFVCLVYTSHHLLFT